MATTEEVYAERAKVVALAVSLAQLQGFRVGVARDNKEPNWPIVYIDLPTGQVSWHFSNENFEDCFPNGLPPYGGVWDGHSTAVKYARVLDFVDDQKFSCPAESTAT